MDLAWIGMALACLGWVLLVASTSRAAALQHAFAIMLAFGLFFALTRSLANPSGLFENPPTRVLLAILICATLAPAYRRVAAAAIASIVFACLPVIVAIAMGRVGAETSTAALSLLAICGIAHLGVTSIQFGRKTREHVPLPQAHSNALCGSGLLLIMASQFVAVRASMTISDPFVIVSMLQAPVAAFSLVWLYGGLVSRRASLLMCARATIAALLMSVVLSQLSNGHFWLPLIGPMMAAMVIGVTHWLESNVQQPESAQAFVTLILPMMVCALWLSADQRIVPLALGSACLLMLALLRLRRSAPVYQRDGLTNNIPAQPTLAVQIKPAPSIGLGLRSAITRINLARAAAPVALSALRTPAATGKVEETVAVTAAPSEALTIRERLSGIPLPLPRPAGRASKVAYPNSVRKRLILFPIRDESKHEA